MSVIKVGVIIAIILLFTAVGASIVSLAVSRVRAKAQVSSRHPSGAPLHWMVSPLPAAMLHRRLRDLVVAVNAAVPQPRRKRTAANRVQSMALEIETLAASADREVILADRAPRSLRSREMARVRRLVETLEDRSTRLVAAAAELDPSRHSPKDWDEKMRELEISVTAHEQALEDLTRFDVTIDTSAIETGTVETGAVGTHGVETQPVDPGTIETTARES